MMTMIENLKLLKSISGVNDKLAFLTSVTDVETLQVLTFLCDPNAVTGLSTKKLQKNVEPVECKFTFTELLNYLCKRNTGSDKEVALVKGFLKDYNEEDRDVLTQVIAKTWTTTIGASLLNKAHPGSVHVFEVQLAYEYSKQIHKFDDGVEFVVTQKLDGFRSVVEIDNGRVVSIRTRKGKLLNNLNELSIKLEEALPETGHYIFDGELLMNDNEGRWTSGERFQQTSKQVSAKGQAHDVAFHIFDALPYDEFVKGQSIDTYNKRREFIDSIDENELVKVVPVLGTCTKDETSTWSDFATENNWEGVMLNDPNARYETKRHKGLLKVKKMHTADLMIVGFEEAIDGKNRGGLKSLIVQLDDENTVNVASGLTEEQRVDIWSNKDQYLGKIVEVKYFEETVNQNGGRSLRFPVVVRFRDDKTIEDINVE